MQNRFSVTEKCASDWLNLDLYADDFSTSFKSVQEPKTSYRIYKTHSHATTKL